MYVYLLCMYYYTYRHTVHTEIFVDEIFCGLNFCGVKFSWLKPPMKICHHENFATFTVCSMERWLLCSETSGDTTFTTT